HLRQQLDALRTDGSDRNYLSTLSPEKRSVGANLERGRKRAYQYGFQTAHRTSTPRARPDPKLSEPGDKQFPIRPRHFLCLLLRLPLLRRLRAFAARLIRSSSRAHPRGIACLARRTLAHLPGRALAFRHDWRISLERRLARVCSVDVSSLE